MKNLNAEQIKRALLICWDTTCSDCEFDNNCEGHWQVLENALALITSQEQRIKELTEENEAWQKRLIATEEKADKAYYELACEVENLRTESERLKARTVDALTEFAESVKRYYSALPGATVGAAVRFYVDEKLKEALDKI